MTDTDMLIEVAKLDGWIGPSGLGLFTRGTTSCNDVALPQYLTSRDAIIPVIEKWCGVDKIEIIPGVRELKPKIVIADLFPHVPTSYRGGYLILLEPKKLCIALLKATGRWRE